MFLENFGLCKYYDQHAFPLSSIQMRNAFLNVKIEIIQNLFFKIVC